MAVFFSGK